MPAQAAPAAAVANAPLVVSVDAFHALWDESVAWLLGHYLQIAIAVLIGALLVSIMLGLRAIALRVCRKTRNWHTHWPLTIGRVVSRTTIWFMMLFAAKLVAGYADPPALVWQTISVLFTIVAALQGAVWVRELILAIVESRADDEHASLGSAMGIIRLLVTVVLFAIATVLILDNLGVNVTGLVAGLGIGGIAIGLAAKGIFDDLFSALSILFDKPFRRGDAIRWDKTSGTVETIGLKTTRVRSVTGEEVVISNTNLLGKELHNMARLSRRRVIRTIGIAYYTPTDVCARLPAMLKDIVDAQESCSFVRCALSDFGASSLDYELQFDVHSEVYDVVFEAQHKVLVAILTAFADARIDFAWPTQTTIPAGPDGRPTIQSAAGRDAPPPSPQAKPESAATRSEVAPE